MNFYIKNIPNLAQQSLHYCSRNYCIDCSRFHCSSFSRNHCTSCSCLQERIVSNTTSSLKRCGQIITGKKSSVKLPLYPKLQTPTLICGSLFRGLVQVPFRKEQYCCSNAVFASSDLSVKGWQKISVGYFLIIGSSIFYDVCCLFKITPNGLQLPEGGAFETLHFQVCTNVH